jgi:hypothetical protein
MLLTRDTTTSCRLLMSYKTYHKKSCSVNVASLQGLRSALLGAPVGIVTSTGGFCSPSKFLRAARLNSGGVLFIRTRVDVETSTIAFCRTFRSQTRSPNLAWLQSAGPRLISTNFLTYIALCETFCLSANYSGYCWAFTFRTIS